MNLSDVVLTVILVVAAIGFLGFDLYEARHGMHKR